MTKPAFTLMTPGPVPLPQEVLEILALPMEHHRTPEFVALFGRVLQNLKKVFLTEQPVFIHTSTGSGGMEVALVNTLSPGDKILVIESGKFGERWADMAEAFGADVIRHKVEWGKVAKIRDIEEHLKREPSIKAILTQACETSSGVLHPIRELAQLTKSKDTLLLVDAITALGALPLPMDEWGIDVVIAGSQKAFMLPTGLSFTSFSKKAWAKTETAKMPKFYFDIRAEKEANDGGESLFSASVTHMRALDMVLTLFLKQGMHKVYDRIQTLSRSTIEGVREMGLQVFSEVPSPSVTAIRVPDDIDGQKVRGDIEKTEKIIVMGGQDQLKGRIIRIGHMGAISDRAQLATLEALANALNRAKPGTVSDEAKEKGLARAKEILSSSPTVLGGE